MADEVKITVGDVNNGTTHSTVEQSSVVDGAPSRNPPPSESDALLSVQESAVCRVKRELNGYVFKKVRLWMVILFMLLIIVAVIVISVAVCSATHVDVDEEYDPSLFEVPQRFSGNFTLPKETFTVELSDVNSTRSRALAEELQNKLADLYRSSPALGRYFNKAHINAFGSDPAVTADYSLTFLLPKEQLDELRNFTLSREMVYNVFRQFLYDQEPMESGPLYIDPVSLQMIMMAK